MATPSSSCDFVSIGRVAGRIRGFAEAIAQAHEFRIGPGCHTQAWSLDFHRSALPIYSAVLPWSYLTPLAKGFKDCADRMTNSSAPVDADWFLVQKYLRSASQAMGEASPTPIDCERFTASEILPRTPPVMPFHVLAEMLSSQAVVELRAACAAVEVTCGGSGASPLNDLEVRWIRLLIDGVRVIDIANSCGYSERSMYRALGRLWDRVGADNRQGGIALVTRNGWV